MITILNIFIYFGVGVLLGRMYCTNRKLKKLTRLIPLDVLKEISKVLEHGAKKYSEHGWKTFIPPNGDSKISWYLTKSKGHYDKYIRYENNGLEQESGCHHLAHAIVNLMFIIWYGRHQDIVPHLPCGSGKTQQALHRGMRNMTDGGRVTYTKVMHGGVTPSIFSTEGLGFDLFGDSPEAQKMRATGGVTGGKIYTKGSCFTIKGDAL